MKVLDRFVRRYRRQSTLKALSVWGGVFSVEVDEVLPALLDGRL